MATILKARGRMTKDLVTPYEVGQEVVFVNPDAASRQRGVRAGDKAVVRRIIISDPNDGDATIPMFYVRVLRGRWDDAITTLFGAEEFVPAAEAEAHLWLRRQVSAL